MNRSLLLNALIQKISFLIFLMVFPYISFAQTSRSTNLTGEQLCFSYKDENTKNRCLAGLNRGNTVGDSYCRKLSNPDSVNSCLASNYRESSYCGNISDNELRNSCYKRLGAGGANTISGASRGAGANSGTNSSGFSDSELRSLYYRGIEERKKALAVLLKNIQNKKDITFLKKEYIYSNSTNASERRKKDGEVIYINKNDYLKHSKDLTSRYRKIEILMIHNDKDLGSSLWDYEFDCENNKFRFIKIRAFKGKDGSTEYINHNNFDFTYKWENAIGSSPAPATLIYQSICARYNTKTSQNHSESPNVNLGMQKIKPTNENLSNSVSCASIKGVEKICHWDFGAFGKPMLKSQQSKKAPCIEGKTYFFDPSNNSIMVNSGCRATFGN